MIEGDRLSAFQALVRPLAEELVELCNREGIDCLLLFSPGDVGVVSRAHFDKAARGEGIDFLRAVMSALYRISGKHEVL